MRELPIRYLAPMVRAVLDGSKTQTRRIVKDQSDMEFDANDPTYGLYWRSYATEAHGEDAKVCCPYGNPGDRQWVQEAWRVSSAHDDLPPSKLPSGLTVEYLADGPGMFEGRTRPSIYMPRWASRITLQITDVRVMRLQDISEADAQAEGIAELPLQAGQPGARWSADPTQPALHGRSPIDAFQRLWESIYGRSSELDNPIVWAISSQLIHSVNPLAIST
jgi:hypothetical protein